MLTLKRYLIHFIILLTACCNLWASETPSEPQTGWDYFARQDFTSADAAFKSNPGQYGNLLGEAFLAQKNGHYSTAMDYFKRAIETEPGNPANEALFCLFPEFKFSTPESMASLPALEKIMGIYKKKLPESAYLRTRLAEELQKMYLAKGEPAKAKSLQEYTGCLADWEFILSPFGKYGVSDLRERFTPEENMNLAQYQGWGRTATRLSAGEASPDGIINVDHWIYPTRGICYLAARIEVSENTQGWMGLKSNTPTRVWVNGETVIIRDISELTPSDNTWSFLKLHKGENYIVIKIADTQSDRSIKLQLLNNQGTPIRFTSLKTRGKSLEKIAYPALDNLQNVSQQEIPPFSFEAHESPKLPDSLLQGIYANYNGWSRQAENIFLNLERQYPQWGYLKLHRGELYFREISRQPASATRYSNQAREIYETALAADSSLPGASLGLGWSYLFQNQFDTALEYAQLLEAQSPDTFLAPALKGEIFKLRGWKLEAEKAFSLTTTRNPAYRQAYQMLADLKASENLETEAAPLLSAAYTLDKSNRKVMDDYRHCLDNQGKHTEAAKLFLGYANSQPDYFLDKLILGDYALKEGNRGKADNYFNAAVELNPNQPLGYEKLADIAILEKDTTKALELLNKAFSLAPDREDLADRIQKIALSNPYYNEFDVALESIDTTGYDATKYPRAAVIYLIDLMVTQYHLDGSSFNMVHQAIKIMNKEGRSKFEELSIPPGARLIYARTIGTDGKVYYPTQVTQTGAGQTLSMYAVEEGAVLDYCYTFTDNAGSRPGSNYSYGLYYFQEKEDPMALSRVTYLLPAGLDFKYRVYPVDFQCTIADWAHHPGWKYYQWEKKASPGIKDEPLMPEMKEVAPNVMVSTYPDWKSIYLPVIDDCRKKLVSSYWLNDKAQELARGLTTDKEKLEAVYQFVTRKIVSGRGISGTVTDTLLMGVGSLQDKTLLVKALLDLMKVKNELLLVATGEQKANESGIPMPGIFSRYLIYLPEHPEGIAYMDLGSPYRAMGNLSENLQGKEAIFLTGSQGKFMILPDTKDTQPNNEHFISITVQPDGNCLIEGTITYQGEMGTYLRDICQDPNKKKRIMDEEVNRLFPGLEITFKEWQNMESLNDPLILSFKGSSKTLLTATPEGYVFNPLVNKLSLGRYVSGAERVHRMDIKDTIAHNDFELQIQIPEGWRLARIPDTLVDFSPFGSYQLQWDSPQKNQWRLRRSVLIGKMEIKPEEFAAFRDFCQKIDAVEKQPLALVNKINPKTKTAADTAEVKETKKAKKK